MNFARILCGSLTVMVAFASRPAAVAAHHAWIDYRLVLTLQAVPSSGSIQAPSADCKDLRTMAALARMAKISPDPKNVARTVTTLADVICAVGGDVRRWPDKMGAKLGPMRWNYPNAIGAKFSENSWHYPTGAAAKLGPTSWHYPDGKTAQLSATTWRKPDGAAAGSSENLIAWACQRIPDCKPALEVIKLATGDERTVAILELAWNSRTPQ